MFLFLFKGGGRSFPVYCLEREGRKWRSYNFGQTFLHGSLFTETAVLFPSFYSVIHCYPPSSSSITPASHPLGKFGSEIPSSVVSKVEQPSITSAALEVCMTFPEKRRRCSSFPVLFVCRIRGKVT